MLIGIGVEEQVRVDKVTVCRGQALRVLLKRAVNILAQP